MQCTDLLVYLLLNLGIRNQLVQVILVWKALTDINRFAWLNEEESIARGHPSHLNQRDFDILQVQIRWLPSDCLVLPDEVESYHFYS